MSKTIYVANLPTNANEQEVQALFSPYGDIQSIKLINDIETDKPLGYGFIEMDDEAADKAILALNGKKFDGQALQVNQARGRNSDR